MSKTSLKNLSPILLFLTGFIFRFMPETRCFGLKSILLRFCGAEVGENVKICSSVKIIGNGNLIIKDNVWIGPQTFISCFSKIEIQENVDIAPRVYLGNGTHEIDKTGNHIAGPGIVKNILIGKGCWLCANSIVLPGVHIDEMSIVASGSVVTKDIPSFVIVGGVPAKHIKNI